MPEPGVPKTTARRQALRVADEHVDPRLRRLYRDDEEVRVEPKVMGLLRYLANRPGKVVTREEVVASADFRFMSPEQFEQRAREAVRAFLPQLAGKRFHVRMHRRGFKGRLARHEEERLLGETTPPALAARGATARVTFDDPDAVLVIDTVGQRAGLALWTREQRARFPFLHVKS